MRNNLIHFPIEKTGNLGKYLTVGTIEVELANGSIGVADVNGYHHEPIDETDITEIITAATDCFDNTTSVTAVNLTASDPEGNTYMTYHKKGNVVIKKGGAKWIRRLISRLLRK